MTWLNDSEIETATDKTVASNKAAYSVVIAEIARFTNAKAKELGFGSIERVSLYAGTAGRYQIGAIALLKWNNDVQETAEDLYTDVLAGNKPMPAVVDVESLLPNYKGPK